MTKFINLICMIFLLFGINISLVWSNDCESFGKIAPLVEELVKTHGEETFEEKYKKELDCCYIDNLECDNQNNVIGIHFSYKVITDLNAFFEGLGNLKSLVEINMTDMYYNNMEQPINVGNIENLKKLVFTSSKYPNLFTNTDLIFMPEGLQNLKKLEILELSHNSIKGNITDYVNRYFVNMDSLKNLNLQGNNLAGPIPAEIKYMKNLESLDLSYNNLDGYIPYELNEMNNLKNLYINNNKELEGYVPLFPNLKRCNYKNTVLCTLKGEKCHAPIQCYKLEIEDGNKHNGVSDPNAHLDRAITYKSEREVNVSGTDHSFNISNLVITGALIVFILL